jgi:hypothetical protein
MRWQKMGPMYNLVLKTCSKKRKIYAKAMRFLNRKRILDLGPSIVVPILQYFEVHVLLDQMGVGADIMGNALGYARQRDIEGTAGM